MVTMVEDGGKELCFDGMYKKTDISSVATSLEDSNIMNRSKGEGETIGLEHNLHDLLGVVTEIHVKDLSVNGPMNH